MSHTHPDSRQIILAAAKKLFSQKGYSGASIADIAKEAEVTKSLVMYHWPSKDKLWMDVIAEALDPYMDLVERYGKHDPSVTVEEILNFSITMHIQNPEIIRMWTWLSLEPGGKLLIGDEKICKGRSAIERVVSDREASTSPEAIRPLMALAISMAAIDGWFCYREMISHVTGLDTRSEEATQEFRESIVRLFLAHLRPSPVEEPVEAS